LLSLLEEYKRDTREWIWWRDFRER
jgi:hypothetical protein